MDQQLANFFIAFTTTGLIEVKDQLDSLNEQLDSMGAKTKSASNDFGAFLGKLGLATAAISGVAMTIRNAFNVGDKAIALRNMAQAAGVAAEKVESLGIALRKYGGDERTAGATYKNLQTLLTEYSQGKIGEEQREVMARYGFSVQAGMTPDQILEVLSTALYNLTQSGRIGEREQVASAFGLDQSTMLLLSKGVDEVRKELHEANGKLVLSNKSTQSNADALLEAKINLQQAWNALSAELVPAITELINVLTPIVELLAPIATWAAKQVGGAIKTGKNLYELATGDISTEEFLDRTRQQNDIFGGTVRGTENLLSRANQMWLQQDAGKSVQAIALGDYTLKDIQNVFGYLQTDLAKNALTQEQLSQMYEITNKAWQELGYTNNSLGSNGSVNTNIDNSIHNAPNVVIHVDGSKSGTYTFDGRNLYGSNGEIIPAMNTTGVR